MKICEVGQKIEFNAFNTSRIFQGVLKQAEYKLLINPETQIFRIDPSDDEEISDDNNIEILSFNKIETSSSNVASITIDLDSNWSFYNQQSTKVSSSITITESNGACNYHGIYTTNSALCFIFKLEIIENDSQKVLEVKIGYFSWEILRDPNPLVQYKPYPYPITKLPLTKPHIVEFRQTGVMNLEFTPKIPGQYKAFLTIKDEYGSENTIEQDFKVIIPDLPYADIIIIKSNRQTSYNNEIITFETKFYNKNYQYSWQLYDQNMHAYGPALTEKKIDDLSIKRGEPYNINLTVTDSNGRVNTTIKNFLLALAKVNIESVDACSGPEVAAVIKNEKKIDNKNKPYYIFKPEFYIDVSENNDIVEKVITERVFYSEKGHPFYFDDSESIAETPTEYEWNINKYLFEDDLYSGKFLIVSDSNFFYIKNNASKGKKILELSDKDKSIHIQKGTWDYYKYPKNDWDNPLDQHIDWLKFQGTVRYLIVEKKGGREFILELTKYQKASENHENTLRVKIYNPDTNNNFPIETIVRKPNFIKAFPGGMYKVNLKIIGGDGEEIESEQVANIHKHFLFAQIKISLSYNNKNQSSDDNNLKFEAIGDYSNIINQEYTWEITKENDDSFTKIKKIGKEITIDNNNIASELLPNDSKNDGIFDSANRYTVTLTVSGKREYINSRGNIRSRPLKEIPAEISLIIRP